MSHRDYQASERCIPPPETILLLNSPEFREDNHQHIKTLLIENAELLDTMTQRPYDVSNGWFYRFIINFLTNLDLSEEEARHHYCRILEHRFNLSSRMHRDVGVRVATLDYFMHVSPRMKNPRIIEISLFEELLKLSKEDPKTGCYNAGFFHETVEKEIKRAARNHASLSLMLIDLDNFKLINDKFGHMMGDKVIERFAACLKRCARVEDVAARFGGDEFALLMPQTGRIGARSLAERFRIALQAEFAGLELDGEPVPVTFSAGIATYPLDATDYEALVMEADKALYHSKQAGRNHIFDKLEQAWEADWRPDSDRRNNRRYRLANPVPAALSGVFEGADAMKTTARIINLSRGGLLLECRAKLEGPLESIPVELALSDGLAPLLGSRVEAQVVRNQTELNFLKFYLGVKLAKPLGDSTLEELARRGIIGTETAPAAHPLVNGR